MSATALPPAASAPEDTSLYQDILRELITLGTALARGVHDAAAAGDMPLPEATVAFDRIARTVRRTVLLARRLQEVRPQAPRRDDAIGRAATRERIIRTVEDTIATAAAPTGADRLHAEFLDRLDSPDTEFDLATRPVAEIIEEITRDLGLAGIAGLGNPFKRRTPPDIVLLKHRARKPPSPNLPSPNPPNPNPPDPPPLPPPPRRH